MTTMTDTKVQIRAELLHPESTFEQRTAGAAGFDLTCPYNVHIKPGVTKRIPTGVRVAIPEGYVGILCFRSGFARRSPGLRMVTNPGIIDSDYRGEIKVPVTSKDARTIEGGTAFAQLIVIPAPQFEVEFGDVDKDETDRGEGGFGSTD